MGKRRVGTVKEGREGGREGALHVPAHQLQYLGPQGLGHLGAFPAAVLQDHVLGDL